MAFVLPSTRRWIRVDWIRGIFDWSEHFKCTMRCLLRYGNSLRDRKAENERLKCYPWTATEHRSSQQKKYENVHRYFIYTIDILTGDVCIFEYFNLPFRLFGIEKNFVQFEILSTNFNSTSDEISIKWIYFVYRMYRK